MLSKEEKNTMIDAQLKEYEQKIFVLEMNSVALLANEDTDGARGVQSRIESLKKAHAAVELMKEG